MKSNLARAALVCGTFALMARAAFAAVGDPISGTSVGLEHDPGGQIVANDVTDDHGNVSFGRLAPGNYVIVVDGPTLVKAMDKQAPSATERDTGGSSLNIGIGGLVGGGGSHHSNDGGGPVGGSHNGSHGGSSTGGVGLGVNVPIGGDSDASARNGNLQIAQFSLQIGGRSGGFSVSQAYCRETAGHGIRLAFKIAENESPRPQDRIYGQEVVFTATVYVAGASGGVWK